MNSKLFVLLTCCIVSSACAEESQSFDGNVLKPYTHQWFQCYFDGTNWISGPVLTETLERPDSQTIMLRQTSDRPDGHFNTLRLVFDAGELRPKQSEFTVQSKSDDILYRAFHEFDAKGYKGEVTSGAETKPVSGKINTSMLHGGTMGLPLASLNRIEGSVNFKAAMIQMDGTYEVEAEWVGQQPLPLNGINVTAQLVDVTWHHNESGDVYPAGPEASGGRYWLVNQPPEGIPYVFRYQTDTYAIEYQPLVCKDALPKKPS